MPPIIVHDPPGVVTQVENHCAVDETSKDDIFTLLYHNNQSIKMTFTNTNSSI